MAAKTRFRIKIVSPKALFLLIFTSLILLVLLHFTQHSPRPPIPSRPTTTIVRSINPFDCYNSPQARPVLANAVDGVKHPFLYSLPSLGNPDQPDRNVNRALRGKSFRRPAIAATVQELLEKLKAERRGNGLFLDVGAGVGTASLAAAVMGVRVVAMEPFFENLQRFCDGVYFNRVGDLVEVFEAAASDRSGNIIFPKESAGGVESTGALAVKSIAIDKLIGDSEPVHLLKIRVDGWEYNVLKGASKLLSRKRNEAPYVIYEEDDHLLEASNSSSEGVRAFLHSMGYRHCVQHGTNAHCTKTD